MDSDNDYFIKKEFPDRTIGDFSWKKPGKLERIIGNMINGTVLTINIIFSGGKSWSYMELHANPWFVFLTVEGKIAGQALRCGASLINARWTVSAAHCLCNKVRDPDYITYE